MRKSRGGRVVAGLGGCVLVATLAPGPAQADRERPAAAPETAVAAVADGVRLPADVAVTRGRWRVEAGPGGVVAWRAPTRLPVTDARVELRVPAAPGTRLVAVPRLTADGRGLRVRLGELAGVRTERLQVWLGADRLDRTGGLAPAYRPAAAPPAGTAAAAGGVAKVPVEHLGTDPGSPGRFEPEAAFDYRAEPLPWREFPAPMEVRGHVVLPRGVDDAPLVLFLHGRHLPCYGRGWSGDWPCDGQSRPVPSQLGYDYLQRRLATRGYASVSIAANAVNAQDYRSLDGGARARSALVRHHLGLVTERSADPAQPRWYQRIDVRRTVLVGHSRGGEGVARAVLEASADAPYDVVGQVLIAPTNFARIATPFTPSVTLLPYCDGDVIDLQGETYTDVGRDLGIGDPSFRASVLMRGANHNFFNTEWTPGRSQAPTFDDWFDRDHPLCGPGTATRLSAAEQRVAGRSWVAAAVRLLATGDPAMLDALDAAGAVTVPTLPGGAVWTHAVGGDRRLVRPGPGATAAGRGVLCRAASPPGFGFERARAVARRAACGRGVDDIRTLHWFRGAPAGLPLPAEVALGWRRSGRPGGLLLRSALDAVGRDTLDLRVLADPLQAPAHVAVRLVDSAAERWTTPPVPLAVLGGGYLRTWWAQTVRVELGDAPARLDLASLARVELVSRTSAGRVWLVDVAARDAGLLPVPQQRTPALSLDRTVVREGDRPRTVRLPWTLSEPAPVAGRFALLVSSGTDAVQDGVRLVEVPAGAQRGVVEVRLDADTRDDPSRVVVELVAVPLRNLVAGRPDGSLVVRDDDR